MSTPKKSLPGCPAPLSEYPRILLAHGGGGRLMHRLIDEIFAPAFAGPDSSAEHDGVVLDPGEGRLAFTTDSYVVDPLFFPGGDIGTLAVNGTVNDLAMCGAKPLYLSAGFIIEEGFSVESLRRVVNSMSEAAREAGVRIVTGDTKVVDKGRGHGLFINTAGVGLVSHDLEIGPRSIQPGDAVILSGDIGRHGIAVMTRREGITFETELESDCAPVASSVEQLIIGGVKVHCLRDLTRGGLATTLVEIAQVSRLTIGLEESAIAVDEQVRGACEILGFDPMYVANEGRFVAIVAASDAEKAVGILRRHRPELESCVIGVVSSEESGLVTVRSVLGAERIVDMLSGEQLPRIC